MRKKIYHTHTCKHHRPPSSLTRTRNCWYCSRECQLANWSVHKKACAALKVARICREDQPTRAAVQGDFEEVGGFGWAWVGLSDQSIGLWMIDSLA